MSQLKSGQTQSPTELKRQRSELEDDEEAKIYRARHWRGKALGVHLEAPHYLVAGSRLYIYRVRSDNSDYGVENRTNYSRCSGRERAMLGTQELGLATEERLHLNSTPRI